MNLDTILIITRNYPPQIGGLETYSYELIGQFEKRTICHKIILSKSKRHLIWFFPFSLVKAIFLIRRHSIGFVHLCDGVLSPIGVSLKFLFRVRVSITVHGLDTSLSKLHLSIPGPLVCATP